MRKFIPILFILFVAFFLLSINLNKPFVGIHDFNGAQIGNAARNYLKFGVWDLRFGQIITQFNGDPTRTTSFYTSYLPLLPLLVALSFNIFGVSEVAERMVPIIFSLIGVLSFYLIVGRVWNKRAAFFACIFYIFTPMFIYYGKMPVFDIPILGMSLLSFYLYLKWLNKPVNKHLILLCISLFFGGLFGWIIVYLGPLFVLHSFLNHKLRWKIVLPLTTLISVPVLQLFHNYILVGGLFSGPMFDSLKNRLTEKNLNFGGSSFSFKTYFFHEVSIFQSFFTRILLVISGVTVLTTMSIFLKQRKVDLKNSTLLTFLLLGLAHPLIFSKVVFIHEYENIYILPFLALAGGVFISNLIEQSFKFRKYGRLVCIPVTVILLVFIIEKYQFSKALLDSKMNTPGFEMAQVINSLQSRGGEVMIISPRFNAFYGIFANFYSKYHFGFTSEQDLKEGDVMDRYKYIIFLEEDVVDRNFIDKLITGYKTDKKEDYTIIYSHEKL